MHNRYKSTNYSDCHQPNIVCIGGGTGLSVMLRKLKKVSSNITAVVTVADDGGGSGMLRSDLNMLPPGDIRQCILALSQTEPLMKELLTYRFKSGSLSGQSFGNLFLAAMTGISNGNFVDAVRKVSDVLRVTGQVLPVTDRDVHLRATLLNGMTVYGESNIGHCTHQYKSKITEISLEPLDKNAEIAPLPEVLWAIDKADLIILGPGSLYTSVLPNLMVPKITDAIYNAKAKVVYINNIMTQPGETDGYTAFDHVNAILKHTRPDFIDYCIMNCGRVDKDLLFRYIEDGATVVRGDMHKIIECGIEVIQADLVEINEEGLIRHNSRTLSETIEKLLPKE